MKIFISYSRTDAGDFAEQIQKHFASFNQYDVFTDVNSIKVGDVWSNTIEDNISNCDIFVIIATNGALRSPNVKNEVLQAQREKKRIIPCFHENVTDNDIKWGLDKIQGIEFRDKYELARDLYAKIAQIESRRRIPAETRTPTEYNEDKSSSDKWYRGGEPAVPPPSPPPAPEPKPWMPTRLPPPQPRPRPHKFRRSIIILIITISVAAVVVLLFASPINHDSVSQNNAELIAKGNDLFNSGRYEQAIEYYDQVPSTDPTNYVYALSGKGAALRWLDQYQEAITYYDKALAIDPNDTYALNNKGDALNNLGRYQEAITYLDKALAIDPNDVFALSSKGNALYGLEQYQEAITYYDKALAIDPNNAYALNNKKLALDKLE